MSSMTDSFNDVKKALGKLPFAIQSKVVTGATRAAAVVIAAEAKANAPERTGLLKKSIGVAKAKKKDTKDGHVKYYVVPKSKVVYSSKITLDSGESAKMKVKQFAWYASMVEFGTINMQARPYLRPAYENSAEKSVKAFQEYAKKRTDKEIEKLKR